MLDNCRRCRRADGSCSLGDRYEELLIDRMMPAEGIIFAMPLYFYGRAASARRKESSRNFRRSLAISAKTSSPSWSATPTAAVRSCPIPAIA